MILHKQQLKEAQLQAYDAAFNFLEERLEERTTIKWALNLNLGPIDTIKRKALLDLIRNPRYPISEPWRHAWRLIEESWNDEFWYHRNWYDVQEKINQGDRSGSLISELVALVAPRPKVEVLSSEWPNTSKNTDHPTEFSQIISVILTSNALVPLNEINLNELTDSDFLVSIAHALEGAVANGTDLARRINPGTNCSWQLKNIWRVHYIPNSECKDHFSDPDEYHHGITPSVKLLHAFVTQLAKIDPANATRFLDRWASTSSPIILRLWASLSLNPHLSSANKVSNVLLSLNDRCFWIVELFPEVAELRAVRFQEFDADKQRALFSRIQRLPPRKLWLKVGDQSLDKIEVNRTYFATRELRRIEVAGNILPQSAKIFLTERMDKFPDLIEMSTVVVELPNFEFAELIPPNQDSQYNLLQGKERLSKLNYSLNEKINWLDHAADWMDIQGNINEVLDDFESLEDGGNTFPKVWQTFGWKHKPNSEATSDEKQKECIRVLSLLEYLSNSTLKIAIYGLAEWFRAWGSILVSLSNGIELWYKIWPIAVESTNSSPPEVGANHEQIFLDTLNTPLGKLIRVFLHTCPRLNSTTHSEFDQHFLRMRNKLLTTTGHTKLLVLYQLIESLQYFLAIDDKWTMEELITPLISDTNESKFLWLAVGQKTQFSSVIKVLGQQMLNHVADQNFARTTRKSLAFSLVIESLYALLEKRKPVIENDKIQQMIRSLEDEVRAHVAGSVEDFIGAMCSKETNKSLSIEELFHSVATPFLRNVWPQERSLTTANVSKVFATLPANSGEEFSNAVETIERFLVPFKCYTMANYGLRGENNLSIIDKDDKAAALLRLLNLTVGATDESVVPYDLGEALDHIRNIVPRLVDDRIYKRLATLARRN